MPSISNTPKILTIIVTYNGLKWLDRCLPSVLNSTLKSDIFVVDNGSTDGTREHITLHYPQAKLVLSNENLGFGRANNIGLQYAKDKSYDYVYLLNQDAWIEPDTFQKLIYISQENPEYGILSPLHIKPDNTALLGYITESAPRQMLSDYACSNIQPLYEMEMIPAAHWLIPRKALLAVGGFSPTFPHYGEDNNYAQRIYHHGFKVGLVTTTRCVHDTAYNPTASKEKQQYFNYIGQLIELSHPTSSRGNIYFIRYILAFLRGRSPLSILYLMRLLKERKSILTNRTISALGQSFI